MLNHKGSAKDHLGLISQPCC